MSDKNKNGAGQQDRYSKRLDIPVDSIAYSRQGKGYKYYLSLKGKWVGWWDEFATSLDDKGRLKYRTLLAFVNSRTKKSEERNFLCMMLGPQPYEDADEKRQVPWLGDWTQRRKQGFWCFENVDKIRQLERAYQDNVDKIESARSLGPVIIKHISRFEKLSDDIDVAFGGQAFLPDEEPTSPKNKVRVRHYLRLHKAALQVSVSLWGQWLRAHGLDPNDPSAWWQMAAGVPLPPGLVLPEGKTIPGELAQTTIPGLPAGTTVDDVLMARMLNAKRTKYNMSMPGDLQAAVTPLDEEVPANKANGKKGVH